MKINQLKLTSESGELAFNVQQQACGDYLEYEIVSQGDVLSHDCLVIEWELPSADIMCQWHPTIGLDRSLKADWDSAITIANSRSAPVFCLIDGQDRNVQTFGLSEFTNRLEFHGGIHEEDGQFKVRIDIHLMPKGEPYSVKLFISQSPQHYCRVLGMVAKWWQLSCGSQPLKVPLAASKPMYSTWYAYHQEVTAKELLKEAKLAKALGLDTIIIDDGWQTADQNRGYGYTGDWQASSEKFSNVKEYVLSNHNMGMKVMMWYSVPFIGKHAKNWQTFSTKLLAYDDSRQAGILDIRYRSVCDYLINIYCEAVTEWQLDGLKLDFIDEFYARKDSPIYQEKMDFISVELALDYLLSELSKQILALNPDCLIEFRQRYIGPRMRQYSNMLRVDDCPKSALTNRVGLVDLRLISGETSCHSDMLMWHPKESAETVAIQFLACIYGVVQISMKLATLSPAHLTVLKNYLAFSATHRQLLAEPLLAMEPENLYPLVKVENQTTSIITLYSQDRGILLDDLSPEVIILNGTQSVRLLLLSEKKPRYAVWLYDCYGELREEREVRLSGSLCLTQFPGGRAVLKELL